MSVAIDSVFAIQCSKKGTLVNLNLLNIFVKVAELGSLTKASKALGHPKSKISRDITKLEKELECHLLTRSPRGVVLTDSGLQLLSETTSSLQVLKDATQKIKEKKDEMSGSIRISAPEDLSYELLYKLIMEFNELFPEVSIDLISTTDLVDLHEHNIDLAFRIGQLKDSSLIQKKVCSIDIILVASAAYLKIHERPYTLQDLSNHDFLPFKLLNGEGTAKNLKIDRYKLSCDSFPILKKFIEQSKGIAAIPRFLCIKELAQKEFIQLLPSESLESSTLYIVSKPSQFMPAHVNEFKNFMYKNLKERL